MRFIKKRVSPHRPGGLVKGAWASLAANAVITQKFKTVRLEWVFVKKDRKNNNNNNKKRLNDESKFLTVRLCCSFQIVKWFTSFSWALVATARCQPMVVTDMFTFVGWQEHDISSACTTAAWPCTQRGPCSCCKLRRPQPPTASACTTPHKHWPAEGLFFVFVFFLIMESTHAHTQKHRMNVYKFICAF